MHKGWKSKVDDPFTNLLHVEVQALGGNAKHGSNKTTGNIHRHDVLVTTLVTHNATAHQTLLYNLGEQEDYMYYVCQTDTHLLCSKKSEIELIHFRGSKLTVLPWGTLKFLSAPCQRSSLGKAPLEKGWGWTLASLWQRMGKSYGPDLLFFWEQRWRAVMFL